MEIECLKLLDVFGAKREVRYSTRYSTVLSLFGESGILTFRAFSAISSVAGFDHAGAIVLRA